MLPFAAIATILVPEGVQAMTLGALLPASVSALALQRVDSCDSSLLPAIGASMPPGPDGLSKSAAILGGQKSRLELVAGQQAGIADSLPRPAALRSSAVTIGGMNVGCQGFAPAIAAARTAPPGLRQPGWGAGDFLASKRVAISRSPFDQAWARVRRDRLSPNLIGEMRSLSQGDVTFSMLSAVNAWTNARIRYVEDEQLYGLADYWAGARTTLRRRAGDCEDIAIVKMQLLAALGVNRADMYLTIARDLVRNADHAVLVVKLGDRNWLLDNSTSDVLDAAGSHDYRPILSYNDNRKWLHGY